MILHGHYAPAGLKAGVILKDRFDFVFPGLFFFVSWFLLFFISPSAVGGI
jgi:hypothetical protein